VKTLRLHNTIYPAGAIERTLKAFNDYGELEAVQDGSYTEIHIEAGEGVDESEIVGGFANYVLTLAVQSAVSPSSGVPS
jgi:hypothetical protein